MPAKLTTEQFIAKAKERNPDKNYDYSMTVYRGSSKPVEIGCPKCGQIFTPTANDHLTKKSGCKNCAPNAKLTQAEFERRSNEKHDFKYDYSQAIFKNVEIPVEIICPVHGSFFAKPHGHMAGFGCDKCRNTYRLDSEDFIKRSKEKFGETFDYSLVEYVNTDTPVILSCSTYGSFEITPREHLRCKSGYNKDIRRKYIDTVVGLEPRPGFSSNWIPDTLEDFISKAKEVHGDLYEYSKVEYKTIKTDVEIICKKHGSFWQSPHNHYRGSGCMKCFCASGESKPEKKLKELLKDFEIDSHNRDLLGVEIDLYVLEYNVGIEVNGIYHHSDNVVKSKTSHLNKTNLALGKDLKLFHFTDAEVNNKSDIIISMIKNSCGKSVKIFARSTDIRTVSYSEYSKFFNESHISGNVPAKIAYGLFIGEELIACMSFGTPRFSKDYEWELLRFCTKLNTTIIGGASKLFKHFIKQNNPKSALSYADRRFGEGNVYNKIGFTFKRPTNIGYAYHNKHGEVVSRYKAQKHKLHALLRDKYDENLSERDNMLKAGYFKIYDCGHNLYGWSSIDN